MSDDSKKVRRKQKLPREDLNALELKTGIRDMDFVDVAKIRKLAYLLVIQRYLGEELEKEMKPKEESDPESAE